MATPEPLVAVDCEPERWEAELLAAGWQQIKLTVWRSPEGELYRGPYGAWRELQRRKAKR